MKGIMIMLNSKNKAALTSLLCVASLVLSACGTAQEPVDIQTNPTITENYAETTTTVPKTEISTEKPETETTTAAPETEMTTPKETETSPKETKPPETTTSETVPETTTLETTPVQPWTETETSGILYINTDGVYSRAEAIQGSTKVAQYSLNDKVNVIARTDTDYFKLEDGSFIHSAYLSTGMTEITQATTAATIAATTAAPVTITTTAVPETAPPAETTNSTWGQYGQRENTQSELDFIAKTFELVNAERAKNGLAAFQHLDVLDTIAAIRAWELTVEYRSDHIRPDGSNGLNAFAENGIIYGAWSENVAAGQSTPQEVVDAWMNSPPHRAAILNTEYTHMGVGYYYSENDTQNYRHFWTLEFYRY